MAENLSVVQKARAAASQRARVRKARNAAFARVNMLPSPDEDTTDSPKAPNKFGDTAAEFSAPFRKNIGDILARSDFDAPLRQRAMDAAMLPLNALGAAYGGTAGLLGDILGGDRTQERKAARDVFMLNEVAVPQLAGVPSAVSRIARLGAQLPAKQAAAQAASRIGVTPTLGMQGRGSALLEAGLEKVPFTTGRVAQAADRTSDQMSDVLDRATANVGDATTNVAAGEAAQRGADAFVSDFQNKSTKLFNAVDDKIGFKTNVQSPNALNTIKELTKYAGQYPEISSFLNRPKFQSLMKSLQKETQLLNEKGKPFQILNTVPYELLKDLRSNIGKSIGKMDGPMSDLQEADLKRLYASLTDDMRLAAEAAGPDAVKAFERANKFYRAGQARIDNVIKDVTNAKSPEIAYNKIVGMTLDNSPRGSVKALTQLKKSLPKEEWSTVSSTILKKLGDTSAGRAGAEGTTAFSASSFLTNWNKMSNPAKTVLTSGNVPQSVRRELDDLATTVARFKGAGGERNFSNTGTIITTAALTAGTIADALKAGIASGSLYLSARALTNETFLKAVNAAAKSDLTKLQRLAQDGTALSSEAATLLRLAGADIAKEKETE
jgi:hypothetical protein